MTSDRERLRRLAAFLESPDAEGARAADPSRAAAPHGAVDLELDEGYVYQRTIGAIRAAREAEQPRMSGPSWGWLSGLNRYRLSLALNVALIGILIAGSGPWNPFARFTPRMEVTEHEIVIYDAAKHNEVWRRTFPGVVQAAKVAPWKDGTTYLLVAELGDGEDGVVRCFDFHEDRELWERRLQRDEVVEFFGHERVDPGTFRCEAVDFVDLEGDGEPEVMVTFLHKVFLPCAVRTYDRDGNVLGTYLHWGLCQATTVTDLDDDGREELVVGGTNNAREIQAATVFVLDRDHLDGASVDRFVPRPGYRDGSRARVLFPKYPDDLMEALNWDRLHVRNIVPDRDDAGRRTLRTVLGKDSYQLYVQLDAELRPSEVIIHDAFARHIRALLAAGRTHTDLTDPVVLQRWLDGHYLFQSGRQVEPPPVS